MQFPFPDQSAYSYSKEFALAVKQIEPTDKIILHELTRSAASSTEAAEQLLSEPELRANIDLTNLTFEITQEKAASLAAQDSLKSFISKVE